MVRIIRIGFFGLLLAVIAHVSGATNRGAFHDLNGQPRTVESYTSDGDWLVVMIWASDCHVCNIEAESYAQLHLAQQGNGIRLLGLSVDGDTKKQKASEFVSRHDLPFPNLIGEPLSVAWYYASLSGEQFRGTPTFLVFRPDGKLAAAQAGAVQPEKIIAYIERKRAVSSVEE